MKIHVPKCHVCKKQVGQPYPVRRGFKPTEVLCFDCPDDSYNARMHPATPRVDHSAQTPQPDSRTAPAVRPPLPKPRKPLSDDRWRVHVGTPDGPPDSLADTLRPAFDDEWGTLND